MKKRFFALFLVTVLPHTAELRYKSTNTKVASVSSTGEITAKAKGTCKTGAEF